MAAAAARERLQRQADYQRAYRARERAGIRKVVVEVAAEDEDALRAAGVLTAIEPTREDLAAAIKRLLSVLPIEAR